MTQVMANLASLALAVARLRGREGDDSSIAAEGWYVDSVMLSNVDVASWCSC